MKNKLIQMVEDESLKKDEIAFFEIGDTVDVHQRILEGNKERVQVFTGTVIARSGEGIRETFTVRRIVQGEGVERIFPIHSPKIAKVVSKRKGVSRRAKLYYLRDRIGKATKLPQREGKEYTGLPRGTNNRPRQEEEAPPPAENGDEAGNGAEESSNGNEE